MLKKKRTPAAALQAAIDQLQGQAALAKTVGVVGSSPRAVVWAWVDRGQAAQDFCPSIERSTNGAVTCEELRPDVVWRRMADADWPWHPDGRPLIDVTEPAAA